MGSVLIVDDIAGNARLVESLLAPDGHTCGRPAAEPKRCSSFEPTRPISS